MRGNLNLPLTDKNVINLPCRPGLQYKARDTLADLHLDERYLHIAAPKGGQAKAFDIPLSRAMVGCLCRLTQLATVIYPEASRTSLFPSDAPSGHMEEQKEDRAKVLSHWGDDLRQTYRTLAQPAGVRHRFRLRWSPISTRIAGMTIQTDSL